MSDIVIRPGHIARHTPRGAGAQGREAAIVDVAQDLLLQHLREQGALETVAIKGGTAIRKLYAGNEGRFSLDLDFATVAVDADVGLAALSFAEATDGLRIGPFVYGITERRGKWSVTFTSDFLREPALASKLDFSPPPWLEPVERGWVPMPIHTQYGSPLLPIKTIRLEENIAEKIARLNRTTTARDMYDLAWIMDTSELARSLDLNLIRRLAVLKVWVDTNGMRAAGIKWGPAHSGSTFDPKRWLRRRPESEFDLEDIGALAVPTPLAASLTDAVSHDFAFLAEPTDEERVVMRSDPRDRSLAIRMLRELPGGRLADVGLY